MDFAVSSKTLDCLEKVIYESHIKLLEKVHEKYLSDLEFSELKKILDGEKGIKFIIKGKTGKDKNNSEKN